MNHHFEKKLYFIKNKHTLIKLVFLGIVIDICLVIFKNNYLKNLNLFNY